MILTTEELRSLIDVMHQSPHTLLGMHALGDGAGVVVRAYHPDAAKIEVQPVHEKDKPTIKLSRIHDHGLFEGMSPKADRVYAYDLVITDHQGKTQRMRDAYSFLPVLSEADLFLFGKGD